MAELTTAWMLGCVCGFFMGLTIARPPRDRDPDWRRSFNHENTNRPSGPPPLLYQPRSQGGTPKGQRVLPGWKRVYFNMPSQIAECGGPCEAGPEHCDCGALWRDEPIRMDEGPVQRGNGKGGPTTPKPDIIPKPQFPSPRKIREDFLP